VSDQSEDPAFPRKEERVLAGFELTPTAPLGEKQRQRDEESRRSYRVDPPVADRHAGREVRACACHRRRRHQPEAGALAFVANQKRRRDRPDRECRSPDRPRWPDVGVAEGNSRRGSRPSCSVAWWLMEKPLRTEVHQRVILLQAFSCAAAWSSSCCSLVGSGCGQYAREASGSCLNV
jgi:hypothetical protein